VLPTPALHHHNSDSGPARSLLGPEDDRDDTYAMTWLSYLRQVYSLETLDTRFVVSSTTPPRDVLELRSDAGRGSSADLKQDDPRKAQIKARAQPSKWNTPEYYFYYLVFIVMVPQMFKAVIDVSKCT
jgi:protein-cysteine N-palmitoyltransferase HHAT